MATVYANSTFNLSADASKNGYGGLFRERAPEYASASLITRDDEDDFYLCFVDTWHKDVVAAPLGSRAWVVQERFLAPRVIHFGEHQVHFECLQMAASEFRPDAFEEPTMPVHTFKRLSGTFDHMALKQKASQADLYRLWDELVFRYTDCDLTYPSDMSAAIEGLARMFGGLLGLEPNDYVYGLWRTRLAHDLMWRRHSSAESVLYDFERTPETNAPSWSWLSIDEGPCSSKFDVNVRGKAVDLLDIDQAQPHSSSLRVRGKMCGAKFKRFAQPAVHVEYLDDDHQPDFVVTVGDMRFEEVTRCSIHWDERSFDIFELLQSEQLYLLLGRKYEEYQQEEDIHPTHRDQSRRPGVPESARQGNTSRYDCLILAPTEKNGFFRRVGYVAFGGPRGRNWGDEERSSWVEHERPVLDRQFNSDDVPTHLYEDVNDDHEYTIWLV